MYRNVKPHLNDILIGVERIEEYVASYLSFEEFSADRKTIDAVVRNFEIIGEAVKNIPPEIRDRHDYEWRSIAGSARLGYNLK